MPFREPDDRLWEAVYPLLPARSTHGGKRSNLRRLFSGVLYVLSTSVAWADTPRCYGAKSTAQTIEVCPWKTRSGRPPGKEAKKVRERMVLTNPTTPGSCPD